MTLFAAYRYADDIVKLLHLTCERIVIAGSIRREREEVKDVEVVLLPKYDRDLYDSPGESYSALDHAIADLIRWGGMAWDESVPRQGPRYKRLVGSPSAGRFPPFVLELFIARPDNFGNILAIRTGAAAFSAWFMTNRSKGGGMPDTMAHMHGRLYQFPTRDAAFAARANCETLGARIIPCPGEQEFFEALQLPLLPPRDRDEAGIRKLKAGLAT